MTVILDRPYEYVPPYRGNLWPTAIQTFRLIDYHLRRRECVLDYEIRHADRFAESLQAGHGILLAPNHCRYADPIVLGWLARRVGTHLFAMASWHLFNSSVFESFALRRMGAFSIYREGNDRQALEEAIGILASSERPLVIFPEGTTNRTNDLLKPLLDGVTFVARTAAKRREKKTGGKVVMLPIGLKYLCTGDAHQWAHEQLQDLERALSWHKTHHRGTPEELIARLLRVSEAYLALKEIEYTGRASAGPLPPRRDALIEHLLGQGETKYKISVQESDSIRDRVRKIRSAVATSYFAVSNASQENAQEVNSPANGNPPDPEPFERDAKAADLAQFLLSFPDQYLTPGQITDTRIVETIQRIQEAIYGKAKETMPLKVVIEVDEPILVPSERAPRGERDPLLCQLDQRLHTMVERLSNEARSFETT